MRVHRVKPFSAGRGFTVFEWGPTDGRVNKGAGRGIDLTVGRGIDPQARSHPHPRPEDVTGGPAH